MTPSSVRPCEGICITFSFKKTNGGFCNENPIFKQIIFWDHFWLLCGELMYSGSKSQCRGLVSSSLDKILTARTSFVVELIMYLENLLPGMESGWSSRNSCRRILLKCNLRHVETQTHETLSVCHSHDLNAMLSPVWPCIKHVIYQPDSSKR